MNRLFDDQDFWNHAGVDFATEIVNLLKPIYEKYIQDGVSAVDMHNIICTESSFLSTFESAKARLHEKGYEI